MSIDKAHIDSFAGVSRMHALIKIMNLLSTQRTHPNIIKLYTVSQSVTHLHLRMEDGGSQNLLGCLSTNNVLSWANAMHVVSQCHAAIAFLHLGPLIVHRDISTESFAISTSLRVKLVDFHCASIFRHQGTGRGKVGTFPFMAPELVLSREYLLLPTDMWSLGVLVMEIMCRVDILTQVCLRNVMNPRSANRESMQAILTFFSQPGAVEDVLRNNMRAELMVGIEQSSRLLQGMLDVSPGTRCTAYQAEQMLRGMEL